MTGTEFQAASFSERIRIILRTGTYLNEVEYPDFRIHLYSISDFYAEVKIMNDGNDVKSVHMIANEDVERLLGGTEFPINAYR